MPPCSTAHRITHSTIHTHTLRRESVKQHTKLLLITSPNVNRFSNSFTDTLSGKFATKSYLNISPQVKYVATLHPFNGPLSGTTRVSRYQKGKTNLDLTEARDSEWQWNPLGRMQVCTSLQTDNHASTPPLSFLQAGCLSCRPTNSIKALVKYECQ